MDSMDSRLISTNIINFDDYAMDSRWTIWIPSGVQMELDRSVLFRRIIPYLILFIILFIFNLLHLYLNEYIIYYKYKYKYKYKY